MVCVVIVAMWAVSMRWIVSFGNTRLDLGTVVVTQWVVFDHPRWDGDQWVDFRWVVDDSDVGTKLDSEWSLRTSLVQCPMPWRYRLGLRVPRISQRRNAVLLGYERTMVSVPFWMIFTLAAIPTAILWHRDRRTAKPGCCRQYGYDLRASKKTCPECGTAVACPEK